MQFVKSLSTVGYAGFRGSTQIDPIWNAYLLALVLEVAPAIESARIPTTKDIVFSYRFRPDKTENTLFDPDLGWGPYHQHALACSKATHYVVATDISDFYPRVYHHRLENALGLATDNSEVVRRIMNILTSLSSGTSYGLPIGGQAARILAELVLNRTDLLLAASGIQFSRFVDDYLIYTDSRESAQSALVELSETLLTNEGLTLSRAKTRVMTSSEFARSSPLAMPDTADSEDESSTRQFLQIRLKFDPYSPSADNDYEELKDELKKFNIMTMLTREIRKSRVDEIVVRQLVKSLRFLEAPVRNDAVISIIKNMEALYPVFPTVAIMLRQLTPDLPADVITTVHDTLRQLIQHKSHITAVPANMAYAIRLLAYDRNEETDVLFINLYQRLHTDMMLKRDIILAMARRRVHYWLSKVMKQYAVLTPWERRALLIASYVLRDEGKHWRNHVRQQMHETERKFMQWVANKNSGRQWEIPL